jgi:hypothetical protein
VKEPTWWEVELQFQAAMCDPEARAGADCFSSKKLSCDVVVRRSNG